MRIYEGSPRQDFEEVFRSVGVDLDRRGMQEVMLIEVPDGFMVQGIVTVEGGPWSDTMGQQIKETLTYGDDDISRFLDEGIARRGRPGSLSLDAPGYYEQALRVLGRYMDEQKPRDVFFLEQDRNYVLRLLMHSQAGTRHVLFEFTREDIDRMIQEAPADRVQDGAGSPDGASR